MISSHRLSTIGSDLRTMKSGVDGFAATWSQGVATIDSAIGAVRENWGGPRPDQDVGAATAYLDAVRELGGQLTSLGRAIEAFAVAAETFADDMRALENQPFDDPDAVTAARSRRESLTQDWLVACFRHAAAIGDDWSLVRAALNATPSGFATSVPAGAGYHGYLARFALDEDMELDEIDPTGELADVAAAIPSDLLAHPWGWLVLAAIETANDGQSVTEADGDLSGADRDDALDPQRMAELISEANDRYGLELSDTEIAELATLAASAAALASASDPAALEDAVARSRRRAQPATSDALSDALADGAPDFVEQASGLFDDEELRVTTVQVDESRVFVFTDGHSTGVFAEHISDTVLVIDAVPSDLTVFARGVGESAAGLGTAVDVVQFGNAALDGWQASEGEPLPERAMSVIAASAPAAADIAIDGGAASAGAVVCSPGGPILSAACAFSAPIFVDFVASLGNPGAPPSYCVDGEFDAEQADAMNFDHTSEEVTGCPPVLSTVPG